MGLMNLFGLLFGGGGRRDVGAIVKDIASVARANPENSAQRNANITALTTQQFAAEFRDRRNRTWWDAFIDGLNRLPRPILALGVLSIFVYTPYDPIYSAKIFAAWAIIPGAVWGLLSIIIAFYFDGRSQVKQLDFEKSIAEAVTRVPKALETMKKLNALSIGAASTANDTDLELETLETQDAKENLLVSKWKGKV